MADIFVNKEKLERAKIINDLVAGKRATRNENEEDCLLNFSKIFKVKGIEAGTESAIKSTYELLGGLVRTQEEQIIFEEKVKEAKKKKVHR